MRRIQVRVKVSFMVNKEGVISYIRILEGVSDELDEEAVRVINTMPNWEPPMIDGEAIDVLIRVPIQFRLN